MRSSFVNFERLLAKFGSRRHQLPEHSLVSVQTVFRFFEGEVHLEVVHHGVRNFFATVSRKAVAYLAVSRSEL